MVCNCGLLMIALMPAGGGTFLTAKKVPKECGIGEGLGDALPRTKRPSPIYPTCALTMAVKRFRLLTKSITNSFA